MSHLDRSKLNASEEGADDLTDLVGMPHAGQDIDFSTLGSMYASQLSLERGIGDSPVRASQPLWSPEIQAAQPKQMVATSSLVRHLSNLRVFYLRIIVQQWV